MRDDFEVGALHNTIWAILIVITPLIIWCAYEVSNV